MSVEAFVERLLNHPKDRIAIQTADDFSLTYGELQHAQKAVEAFYRAHYELKMKRIAYLVEDAFSIYPILLGSLGQVVLVPIDGDVPFETFRTLLKQDEIEYLWAKETSLRFIEEAISMGCGIIEQTWIDHRLDLHLKKSCEMSDQHYDEGTCLIVHTSGTTDEAKRVSIKTQAYLEQVLAEAKYYSFPDTIKHVITSKPSRYVSGFIAFRVFYAGGTILVHPSFNPSILLKWFRQYENLNCSMTPSGLLPLIHEAKRSGFTHQGQLVLFLSGSYVNPKLCDEFKQVFNVRFIKNYGSTETGAISSSYHAIDHDDPTYVGALMYDDVQLKRVEGELWVKGSRVFEGYMDVSRDVCFQDGWFRTGDLARLEDRLIFLEGRSKDIINRGGDKVSPYALEQKILLHPAVLDTIVFPIQQASGVEDIACALVLRDGERLELNELRAHLRTWLIPYHCPTQMILVDQIEHGTAMKVERNKLQVTYAAQLEKQNKFADQDPILMRVQSILGCDHLSLEDDFFDQGGDSLKASEAIAEIEAMMKARIDIQHFIADPKIKHLYRFVDLKYAFLVLLKENKASSLICVHSGDGDAMNYRFLARALNDTAVYALQYNQRLHEEYTFTKIEDMLDAYIDEIITLPGPYHLLGDCLGGGYAFALAQRMQERGIAVASLVMLDTPVKGEMSRKQSLWERFIMKIKRNLKNLESMKMRDAVKGLSRAFVKMVTWLRNQKSTHESGYQIVIKKLYRDYVLGFLKCDLLYIQASEDFDEKAYSFWKSHVRQSRLRSMGCRHGEFLFEKNSGRLAEIIQEEGML